MGLAEPEPEPERREEAAAEPVGVESPQEYADRRAWEAYNAAEERQYLAERAEVADIYEASAAEEAEEGVLAGALETLEEEFADPVIAWHQADQVAAVAPERLDEYMAQWYAVDPAEATRYTEALREQWNWHTLQAQQDAEAAWQSRMELEQQFEMFRAARQAQLAVDASAAAISDETKRLSKADPWFDQLRDTISSLAGSTLRTVMAENNGIPPDPAASRALIQSSFEAAVALREAQDRAAVKMPFDEADYNNRHRNDRNHPGPWNSEEAWSRLVAEELELRPYGAVSADREAQRRGFAAHPTLGTPAQVQDHEARHRAEIRARNARSAQSLKESGEQAQRAIDRNEEYRKKTGRRRPR